MIRFIPTITIGLLQTLALTPIFFLLIEDYFERKAEMEIGLFLFVMNSVT